MSACSPIPRARITCSTTAWCAYDVEASLAHADMLARAAVPVAGGLRGDPRRAARHRPRSMRQGVWHVTLDQEDCQTAIENRLTARIGAAGGRLHAGRSRNDQVLAALRLYLRDATHELHAGGDRGGRGARGARGARGLHRAAGLHSHAAGHAEHRRAVGARIRGGDSRRCGRAADRGAARREEPARLGRRLRHAQSRHRAASRRAARSVSPSRRSP